MEHGRDKFACGKSFGGRRENGGGFFLSSGGDQDHETMNAIELEVQYLQRLMEADEGYQEGYQPEPEIDTNGPNRMNNAQ